MIRKYIFGLTLLTMILMFLTLESCKERSLRHSMAGPKKMTRYQWVQMDGTGNFTKVLYDTTDLAEVLLWDNSTDGKNAAGYYGKAYPASWAKTINGVGAGGEAVFWYSDYDENESFTFFSEPKAAFTSTKRATYSLKKKLNGVIELTGVFASGGNTYKEVIELTPIAGSDL